MTRAAYDLAQYQDWQHLLTYVRLGAFALVGIVVMLLLLTVAIISKKSVVRVRQN